METSFQPWSHCNFTICINLLEESFEQLYSMLISVSECPRQDSSNCSITFRANGDSACLLLLPEAVLYSTILIHSRGTTHMFTHKDAVRLAAWCRGMNLAGDTQWLALKVQHLQRTLGAVSTSSKLSWSSQITKIVFSANIAWNGRVLASMPTINVSDWLNIHTFDDGEFL